MDENLIYSEVKDNENKENVILSMLEPLSGYIKPYIVLHYLMLLVIIIFLILIYKQRFYR